MKKLVLFLFTFLTVFTIGISNIFAEGEKLNPIHTNVSGINIQIDPRIELLAAVQILSGYGEQFPGVITREEFTYKNEMLDYFKPYSEHKAVKLFKEMSSEGFSYDGPPTGMLYYSQSIDLELERPVSDYVFERAGGEKKFNEFIEALKDFAKESKFDKFYKNHEQYYTDTLNRNIEPLKDTNYIKEIEDYYGKKNKSYTIIFAPLFHPGGYGPKLEDEKGNSELYCILGPSYVENDIPIFGDKMGYEYLIFHEFSHSFVNPITSKYIDDVNKYDNLFDPISTKMQSIAYNNWETSINEHLLRAFTARQDYKKYGLKIYNDDIYREKSQGFYYIEPLVEDLIEYENNRDKYKTFEDFYPQIINTFKELSDKNLEKDFYTMPFNGSITSATNNGNDVVVVVSTEESDKNAQKQLQAYAEEMKNFISERMYINVTLLTDKEALNANLSDKNIITYGTVEGNLFLKKYFSNLPFKVESNKIVVGDKSYRGNNLRLIAGYESPFDKNKGMVVYTAQRAKDIIDINSFFHGPKGYYVFDDNDEIVSGNYSKINNKLSVR